MSFQKHVEEICHNITLLANVHCALLNLTEEKFCTEPFHMCCDSKEGYCDAIEMHLANCKEAARWSGRYLYSCPSGYHFIATTVKGRDEKTEYGIIVGPLVLTEETVSRSDGVAVLNHEKVSALKSMLNAYSSYLMNGSLVSDREALDQEEALQTMYISSKDNAYQMYPIEDERLLQQMIRTGQKTDAQSLLNAMLFSIYSSGGTTNIPILKRRIHDLITLMSRAATDIGVDVDTVFTLCDKGIDEINRVSDIDELNIRLGELLHAFFDLVFEHDDAKHANLLRNATIYIQKHLSEKITLDDIAEHVYLSKSYLCRLVKNELDCTVTEYVNRLRIDRAKTYLLRSTLSLSEIAVAVGFDNQSYFTRIFKKHTGTSPGKYRLNNR